MNKTIWMLGIFGLLLLNGNVHAQEIEIDSAWSRATAPGQDVAMVDLNITSNKSVELIKISSPACKKVELHSMSHEDGMMKMREVKSVALPAGKRVNLGESGYHLMLIGLKSALKAGDNVPLTLTIKSGKETIKIDTTAEVRPLTENRAVPQQSDEHMHHMHH